MGMIMVVGIVAKNGILLLDADQKFRGLGMSAEDAMLQASRRRLRPIVMTALATVAACCLWPLRSVPAPNAATAGYLGHRRHSYLDDPVIDHHAHGPFYLSHEPAKESGFPPASRT